MTFQNPEYIGLMYLHAARWKLKKLLAGRWSTEKMRALRAVVPYQITTHGDQHPMVLNRHYSALSEPYGAPRTQDWLRFPRSKSNLWTADEHQQWLFNDGNPPWRDKESAERYLEFLEFLIDFSLDDLPEVTP